MERDKVGLLFSYELISYSNWYVIYSDDACELNVKAHLIRTENFSVFLANWLSIESIIV